MNKKIFFSLVLIIYSLQSSLICAQLDTIHEKPTETFPLNELPKDVQGLIISYMWAVGDSKDEFEKIALELDKTKPPSVKLVAGDLFDYIKQQTSTRERKKYDFNGNKTPINFYTSKDNKPSILEVGCIIDNAQPTTLNGFSFATLYAPTIRIFLDSPSGIYTTSITHDKNKHTILACSLSVHGDLAIAWEGEKYFNFTFSNLDKIKGKQPIDLDQNPMSLDLSNLNMYLHTMLFNGQGTVLACVHHVPSSLKGTMDQVFSWTANPNNNTPLTADRMCKRIMQVPIAETKALVKQKKELKRSRIPSLIGYFKKNY